MTLNEIKNISIKSYLESIGCKVVVDRNYYGLYLSPYREDANASLKVDYNKNLWHDFGSNQGGSIIDLDMIINQCSFTESIARLKEKTIPISSFSFHREDLPQANGIEIKKVKKLEHVALLQYLHSRKISLDVAKKYCQEVYYITNNKQYFAIAFENN